MENIPKITQPCPHADSMCVECQDRIWEKKQRARKADGLRAKFSELTLRGLVNEVVREARWSTSKLEIELMNPAAWKQARTIKGNAYIWGGVGTGKSYLCRCILREAFINERSIADVSMLAYLTKAKYDSLFCSRVKRATYLLLDDIDKASFSDPQAVPQFWELMNERATHKRITLITSNIDFRELLTIMSKHAPSNSSIALAALDRLKPCTQIEMRGRSQR